MSRTYNSSSEIEDRRQGVEHERCEPDRAGGDEDRCKAYKRSEQAERAGECAIADTRGPSAQ